MPAPKIRKENGRKKEKERKRVVGGESVATPEEKGRKAKDCLNGNNRQKKLATVHPLRSID